MELVVDNFAGGGGASTGIEMAIGRSVDIAINHDPEAIAMHEANHPTTEHFCESVWDVDPRKVVRGRQVGLCWLSPDCKHFSKAKGGKPLNKNIRGLAWVAVRWAATVRPRVIMLENVEEFKTWGPLLENGYPDPKKKGRTFQAFVNALKRYGYQVEWKELRACDYGAPTLRKRFFMIARCDGKPIVWPAPTHGDPNSSEVISGKLQRWRTAAEIIDWSLPCPSIFERKKMLAENTLKRIAKGLQKYVLENPNPFILRIGQTGFGGDRLSYSIDKPLTTIVSKAEHLLITPFLSKYHGETSHTDTRGQMVNEPIRTIDTANRFAMVTSHLIKMRNNNIGQTITEPMHTITAGGLHFGEIRASLLKYYGTNIGQACDEPLHTITTKARFAVKIAELLPAPLTDKQRYNAWWCARLLEKYGSVPINPTYPGLRDPYIFIGDYILVDIGMRMLEPHELFPAQGFPKTYIIDRDSKGKRISKASQVARCGNSVPPVFAEALVRANLPEICGIHTPISINA